MIEIVFFAPCDWDRNVIGAGSAQIAYTGQDPVRTAQKYVMRNFGHRARVFAVVKDGYIWQDDY